jgi:hypothetical protein
MPVTAALLPASITQSSRMPRYLAQRPRAVQWGDDWADDPVMINSDALRSIEVHEGPKPIPTGLYDADGNELMRIPDQIGFIRFEGGK